ncbi:MAG TPA: Rne/Rng family ribonuclease [Actinomycetota bacterium]|nr:Rne/Rng family ribonuclease [Actinomycetota bacterium]
MNDQPAGAVEDKPPTAPRAPRKRRAPAASKAASADTAPPDTSTDPAPKAEAATKARTTPKADAAPPDAPATPAATGDEPAAAGEAKPKRVARTRTRKSKATLDSEAAAAAEAAAAPAAPEPAKAPAETPASESAPAGDGAPTVPFAERRSRAPRRKAGAAAAAPEGEPVIDTKPAAEAEAPVLGAASSETATEDSGSTTPREGRPRRRRSRSSGSGSAATDASTTEEGEAPAAPAAEASSESVTDDPETSEEGPEGADGDQASSGNGAGTARTRNRRRRSRSRGSGSGESPGRTNGGGEPAEAGTPSSNGTGSGGATVPAVAEPLLETRESRSSSSSSTTRGGRKRRTSRRPRLEHIAPLGPRKMLVTTGEERSQIAVLEGRELIEHYVAKHADESIVGNVYIGRVENVLPGMEAAFLDIGEARNAVLYVGEVSYEEDLEGPPPRIETLLKSGQAVVAQVTKDPMGSKGARLTTEVSLAGRYLVLVPNSDSLGISRRLADAERRRLRDIANRIRPEGHGMIVRTAAVGASEEDLERDMTRLTRIWNEVSERIDGAKPPKLIYSEPPLAIRVVRDLFTADVEEVIVDSEESYHQIRDYLEEVAPEFGDRVSLYTDGMPLFERYHVTEQVRKAIDRKVWLQSGGHIVIDRTEAMTVIDVNTGRYVGRSTLEDTVLHANLEAAEEVAKQLRLRDIGGIIVIDFIDMGYERNRDELLRTFERALLRDKTRTQVYGVSELGLVQMTRKKVSEGLLEAFSHKCEPCDGRGVILHDLG